jgi:hypothetical protein
MVSTGRDTYETRKKCVSIEPSRVQLGLVVEQAELFRESLFIQAEHNADQRTKIPALHEHVMGALSNVKLLQH